MQARRSSEYSMSLEEISRRANDSKQNSVKTPSRKVYQYLFKDIMAVIAVFPSIIAGLTPIISYQFVGNVITELGRYSVGEIDDPLPETKKQMIYLTIVLIIASISFFFSTYLWNRVGCRMSVRIRRDVFSSMMRFDVAFFDSNSIGSLLTILGEEATAIQEAFGSVKNSQIQSLAQFVVGFIMIYIQSWRLGLIMSASIPLILLAMIAVNHFLNRKANEGFQLISSGITIAEETISNVRTVRAFNGEEGDIDRFSVVTMKSRSFYSNFFVYTGIEFFFLILVIYGFTSGVLYYGATIVGNKENGQVFTSGALIAIFGFATSATWALTNFQFLLGLEERAVQSAGRVMDMIGYQPSINIDGGIQYDDFKGDIVFDHVSFMYPSRNVFALNDVSFQIKSGQNVAFVGHSGSGKSTIVQLIERFYDVTEGAITIDGHDIKDIDPRWLHKQLSLVSQEPSLFHGTIKENVLYGVFEAKTDEEIMDALEQANAKKFIMKFDDSINHQVGDRGSILSGGQRQRIAIARAVMKNPKILITDEATSALDSESEKKVQSALDKVLIGRTGIAVAHRLSTVISCDVIFVIDSGKIVEQGKHAELVEKGGAYYNLVKYQLRKSETKA
ncbi:ABC transporter family protein [Trichomonas vaginalis G3]|uniref:ABC transporter family protein n=1 Tax=Trichomonas vaginalis (strain ATCC PRA-98 / G3) TaxID=412133 RepID=A2FZA2_TRIV3|nr:mitochondrial ATP-dependent permease MDL1 family [Trichomonas vaginalis G3]EAX89771.1 ABC transporter family protein [Trichomonas vaginalis G3]KAI5492235.1 mitochondrial ATP-dependent permease MDL1 family [Trichomonas vaginalis G3]|eukprot:XP_001302701.1 ABC transporter family protein [Trichomonas vaginalis G3]